MKAFLCAFLFNFLPITISSNPSKWLREFVKEATDQKLNNTELADKYFCTVVLHRSDEKGEKARKSMDWALTTQRHLLQEQQVNIDEVKFTPFDMLPASELPAKPFHMLSETKHVYVAQYHGKTILYFLLQDDKIASTLLLGQGNEHYFIDFCK